MAPPKFRGHGLAGGGGLKFLGGGGSKVQFGGSFLYVYVLFRDLM